MKTVFGYFVWHIDYQFPYSVSPTKKLARADFLDGWSFKDMKDARKSGWIIKKLRMSIEVSQ